MTTKIHPQTICDAFHLFLIISHPSYEKIILCMQKDQHGSNLCTQCHQMDTHEEQQASPGEGIFQTSSHQTSVQRHFRHCFYGEIARIVWFFCNISGDFWPLIGQLVNRCQYPLQKKCESHIWSGQLHWSQSVSSFGLSTVTVFPGRWFCKLKQNELRNKLRDKVGVQHCALTFGHCFYCCLSNQLEFLRDSWNDSDSDCNSCVISCNFNVISCNFMWFHCNFQFTTALFHENIYWAKP